jgi:hypothetical protein
LHRREKIILAECDTKISKIVLATLTDISKFGLQRRACVTYSNKEEKKHFFFRLIMVKRIKREKNGNIEVRGEMIITFLRKLVK